MSEDPQTAIVTLASLAPLPMWVAWQTQLREKSDKRPTKIPYSPAGPDSRKARADDPATWGDRTSAEARASRLPKPFGTGGVGLEFTEIGDGTSIGGVDLDACRDHASGDIEPWAMAVIDSLGSYAEVSPSQTGAKVFFRYAVADLPALRAAIGGTLDGKPRHGVFWKRPGKADHPPAIELHLLAWCMDRAVVPRCRVT